MYKRQEQTQCTIVGQAAVLAEGDAAERKDIIFLEPLPLFFQMCIRDSRRTARTLPGE